MEIHYFKVFLPLVISFVFSTLKTGAELGCLKFCFQYSENESESPSFFMKVHKDKKGRKYVIKNRRKVYVTKALNKIINSITIHNIIDSGKRRRRSRATPSSRGINQNLLMQQLLANQNDNRYNDLRRMVEANSQARAEMKNNFSNTFEKNEDLLERLQRVMDKKEISNVLDDTVEVSPLTKKLLDGEKKVSKVEQEEEKKKNMEMLQHANDAIKEFQKEYIHGEQKERKDLEMKIRDACREAWGKDNFKSGRARYDDVKRILNKNLSREDTIKEINQYARNHTTYNKSTPLPEIDKMTGLGKKSKNDDGLSDAQINKYMGRYKHFYGAIARDEIDDIDPERGPIAFICNTDPSYKPGRHWVAIYIDPTHSVEYYDSFGDDIPKTIYEPLMDLADYAKSVPMLKLKVNSVVHQNNSSSNCGYFAMEFLIKRFRGESFAKATGFEKMDKSKKYEKEIENMKRKEFRLV